MIRALFLSVGLFTVLCGFGLFLVKEVTLSELASTSIPPVVEMLTTLTENGQRALTPPEWLPYTSVGVGGVTMLYALALPRRSNRYRTAHSGYYRDR